MAKKKRDERWYLKRIEDGSFEIVAKSSGLLENSSGVLEFVEHERIAYRADKSNKQLAAYVTIGDSIEIAPIRIDVVEKLPF